MENAETEAVRRLLEQWYRGETDAVAVHQAAESLWESREWPVLPPSSHDSIVIEVISHLDALNQQLVIADDVPQILQFLSTPPGQELVAWEEWRRYWDGINYDERRVALRGIPPYAV